MSRARTVFFGSGGFGASSLRRLGDHPDVELVGVVTAPPRPAGRAGRLTATPIDAVASELGVAEILRPERLRSPESIDAVLALRPELAVLADYGQIVPRPILELPRAALNLHPSLLPRHRGATPIQATILAGDKATGVSLIQMDEGLDTGPIVAQSRRGLDGTETAPDLEERLAIDAGGLLRDTLGPWIRGEVDARPQGEHGATLTRPLRRDDGRIDPAAPAERLARQVRAYQPWPGSWFESEEGRITVWSTGPGSVERAAGGPQGLLDARGLTAAGSLLVLGDVQLAGGRRMSWSELLRGRPGLIGTSVREPVR